jgi:hypothetical protein
MARGTAQEAKQNAGAGASQNATYSGRANDAFNAVFPQLQNQAQNGLPQADQAALNTASQQSIGGSNAGAAGQANLAAARTRNAGAYAPAVAESVRSGQRQNSENALGRFPRTSPRNRLPCKPSRVCMEPARMPESVR